MDIDWSKINDPSTDNGEGARVAALTASDTAAKVAKIVAEQVGGMVGEKYGGLPGKRAGIAAGQAAAETVAAEAGASVGAQAGKNVGAAGGNEIGLRIGAFLGSSRAYDAAADAARKAAILVGNPSFSTYVSMFSNPPKWSYVLHARLF